MAVSFFRKITTIPFHDVSNKPGSLSPPISVCVQFVELNENHLLTTELYKFNEVAAQHNRDSEWVIEKTITESKVTILLHCFPKRTQSLLVDPQNSKSML